MKTLNYSKFTTIEDIKDKLSELLKFKVAEIGYIEPGHGLKGKQQTLIDDDDIDEMYDMYKNKRCGITLWWYTCVDGDTDRFSKKRTSLDSEDKAPRSKRKDTIAEKLSEVELAVKQLKDKHGSKYSIEQLNASAHMISVGKHCSLKIPQTFLILLKKHDHVKMTLPILSMHLPYPQLTSPVLLLLVFHQASVSV